MKRIVFVILAACCIAGCENRNEAEVPGTAVSKPEMVYKVQFWQGGQPIKEYISNNPNGDIVIRAYSYILPDGTMIARNTSSVVYSITPIERNTYE